MNKKVLLLMMLCFCFCRTYAQETQTELTAAQKKFQTEFMTFLKEEGFMPSTDNGGIKFKSEGDSHWIYVYYESPFFIIFRRAGYSLTGENKLDETYSLLACNNVNRNEEVVKLYCTEEAVMFNIEQYTRSVEDFKYVFYKNLSKLVEAQKKFIEKYQELNNSNSAQDTSSDRTTTVSDNSTSSDGIAQFFPVYGITLGQTTTQDLKKMGHTPKLYENGPKHHCDVETITFWDHDGDNIYEYIFMLYYKNMPAVWTNKFGFKWELSYNDWLTLFQRLGFSVKIIEAPVTKKYDDRNTLSAKLKALSADKHLEFTLDFNYGNDNNEGYSINSKKSLFSINVEYKE
ncbi:MAG: hypothetical protein LBT83_00055 [Tannerella sp.]|jgi:hypothetical protein|nr:hypothetical protein [Tannerella sp.]